MPDISSDCVLQVWVKEAPLHGRILSYISEKIEVFSTEFNEKDLLFLNPKDLFSIIETCHVCNKSEDAVCYLLARYLVHHGDDSAGIIDAIKMYSLSIEMLETVYRLPYFESFPEQFKSKIIKEFETRITPRIEKQMIPRSRAVLGRLNTNTFNL